MSTIANAETIGRPVRVVSLCFRDQPFHDVMRALDQEGARGADLIALPETWRGQSNPEPLDGETVSAAAKLARRHHAYIVCPIDRVEGGRRFNTAVLIDRHGDVAGAYDKVYPYWSEFDLTPCVEPATDVPVYETDFGRLGLAICFDVNFPAIWQSLAEGGAELVIWPSAYSGGTSLQAHAINHHYYIVTSTLTGDCQVYDITGARVLDEQGMPGGIHVSRATLDLDRGIYHENFNSEKRDQLLRDRADDVLEEQRLGREGWFVLKAKRPDISARTLAHDYGMEELRDYLQRSRREIDERRAHCGRAARV